MKNAIVAAVMIGFIIFSASTVDAQPVITVTPETITQDLLVGSTAVRTVTISNTGTTDLQFDIAFQGHLTMPLASQTSDDLKRRPVATPTSVDHVYAYRRFATEGIPTNSSSNENNGFIAGSTSAFGGFRAPTSDSFVVFYDDMERGANGWTHSSLHVNGIDQWSQSMVRRNSGLTSWRVTQHDFEGDDALRSPSIDLTKFSSATLAFYHWYKFDNCGSSTFVADGGIVEVSINGGSTWAQISPVDGYPYVLDDICDNPLAYREAYSQSSGVGSSFVPAVFDLTPFAGHVIAIRFRAGWDCGNCDNNEGWFVDDVAVYSRDFVSWLTAAPESGTIAPGGSTDVSLTFDATDLFGGQYLADLQVTSNDPATPLWTVPTTLNVTGIPHLAVTPAAASFGSLYLGLSVAETLTVVNDGTDNLIVSSIVSSNPEFAAGSSSLTIQPNRSTTLVVTFSPGQAGIRSGNLTFNSNDPLTPALVVSLEGEGILPPDISVTPDSLDSELFTGTSENQTLTIENVGSDDLVWEMNIVPGASIPSANYFFLPPMQRQLAATVDQSQAGQNKLNSPWRNSTLEATLLDLTGVTVLFDEAHGNINADSWSILISDLRSRGATVVINASAITDASLASVDVFWLAEPYGSAFSLAEINALSDWLATGGGLLIEGDESLNSFNDLLAGIGANIRYQSQSPTSGITNLISPHQITQDVGSVAIENPLARLTTDGSLSTVLVKGLVGEVNVACEQIGAGRIVAMADENFYDGVIGVADNELMGNQAVDWLSKATGFVKVEPTSGSIAAGNAELLTVTFDATRLYGGDYFAELFITSNDPDEATVRVPTHLHVTGAPDITLSPSALDFGALFIGRSLTDTVVVTNIGTDLLQVTAVSSDLSDYTVAPTNFDLSPGGQMKIVVTFTPSSAGPKNGTLTIASNDPDVPLATVPLTGLGLIPPDISVSPTSMDEHLLTNQTSTQQLTVFNGGGSDLTMDLSLQFLSGSSLVSSASSELALQRRLNESYEQNPDKSTSTQEKTASRQSELSGASSANAEIAGTYVGDHLQFGLSNYGEVMPFQYPIGNEHLLLGSYISGYLIAYKVNGIDHVAWCSYQSRSGIAPVSYAERVNNPSTLMVEVVTRTTDNLISLTHTIMFDRSDKYISILTKIENLSGSQVTDIVFKSYADWDTDGTYFDDWNYDLSRNMIYSWRTNYTAIAANRVPDLMDIDGWSDYQSRNTYVNYPVGPVTSFDGLEILHFDMGNLEAHTNTTIGTTFGAGNSLADLQGVIDRGNRFSLWLKVEPEAAVIPAGTSQQFDVHFDATGLYGGDYTANIRIQSNDPDEAEVQVPVHLQVTGVPDVGIEPTSLSFGTCLVGNSSRDTITVTNVGTDLLVVSDITAGNLHFSATPTSFALVPNQSQTVEVIFRPEDEGDLSTTLTITSNDPDEAVLVLPIHGFGLFPPEIHVAPTLLAADLLLTVNPQQEDTLVISNTGRSDLVWTATIGAITTRDSAVFLLYPPTGEVGGHAPNEAGPYPGSRPQARTAPIQEMLGDLTGVTILLDESKSFSGWSSSRSIILADLQSRGATIRVNYSSLTSSVLTDVQVIWMADYWDSWYAEELAALNTWVRAGGSILLETDQTASLTNVLLAYLGAGITYEEQIGVSGITTDILPHESTEGVDEIYIEYGLSRLSAVTSPATVLVRDMYGENHIACSQVGLGRIVAIGDEDFSDWSIGIGDNQLFGNQVIDWLAHGTNWLTLDPPSGTTPVGATSKLAVTIDGTGLRSGDYTANIRIESNDPGTPTVGVPVTLHVREYLCGDANGNGVVNRIDLDYLVAHYFRYGPGPNPAGAGDFNCDHMVNLTDISLLVRYLYGGPMIECCH